MAWHTPRTWTDGEVPTEVHFNEQLHDNLAVLFVTHAIHEAVLLSDRIVCLTNGPGSKIGMRPDSIAAILPASLSTQQTSQPNSEKHAPDTSPT